MRLEQWKQRTRELHAEVYALYLALRDPRVGLPARIFLALAVGLALSPIDLIPDFIPVIGLLDDLVVVPACILIARRLAPPEVMDDCRRRARAELVDGGHAGRIAAAVIIGVWLAFTVVAAVWGYRWFTRTGGAT